MSCEKAILRRRRRFLALGGTTALLLLTATAVGLATGCVFDQGGYQGGGRRTGTPTDDTEATATATATATEAPTSTTTALPNDGGRGGLDGNVSSDF